MSLCSELNKLKGENLKLVKVIVNKVTNNNKSKAKNSYNK